MDQSPNPQRTGQNHFQVLLEGLGLIYSFSRFPMISGWGISDNVSIETQPAFQPNKVVVL